MFHWDKADSPKTKHCIVLDIDETLVHTFEDEEALSKLRFNKKPDHVAVKNRIYHFGIDNSGSKKGSGEVSETAGILRPGVEDFLSFCFGYFDKVVVWSAGTDQYVKAMVDRLFRDLYEPHIVFTRNACTKDGDVYVKPLDKLFKEDVSKSLKPENTFVLDDKRWTFIENPENAILIPPYEPHKHDDTEHKPPTYTIKLLSDDDDKLLKLQRWFETKEVMNSKDIRKLDKNKIFSLL